MTFDSIELDERKIDNVLRAISSLRRIDIINMKKDLAERANNHQKTFSKLFDITTMKNDGQTRDMLQYQYFQEFYNEFDHDTITSYLNKLRNEIETTPDRNERRQKKHIAMLLEKFITFKIIA